MISQIEQRSPQSAQIWAQLEQELQGSFETVQNTLQEMSECIDDAIGKLKEEQENQKEAVMSDMVDKLTKIKPFSTTRSELRKAYKKLSRLPNSKAKCRPLRNVNYFNDYSACRNEIYLLIADHFARTHQYDSVASLMKAPKQIEPRLEAITSGSLKVYQRLQRVTEQILKGQIGEAIVMLRGLGTIEASKFQVGLKLYNILKSVEGKKLQEAHIGLQSLLNDKQTWLETAQLEAISLQIFFAMSSLDNESNFSFEGFVKNISELKLSKYIWNEPLKYADQFRKIVMKAKHISFVDPILACIDAGLRYGPQLREKLHSSGWDFQKSQTPVVKLSESPQSLHSVFKCPISLDFSTQPLSLLQCGHVFSENAIQIGQQTNRSSISVCPTCRSSVQFTKIKKVYY